VCLLGRFGPIKINPCGVHLNKCENSHPKPVHLTSGLRFLKKWVSCFQRLFLFSTGIRTTSSYLNESDRFHDQLIHWKSNQIRMICLRKPHYTPRSATAEFMFILFFLYHSSQNAIEWLQKTCSATFFFIDQFDYILIVIFGYFDSLSLQMFQTITFCVPQNKTRKSSGNRQKKKMTLLLVLLFCEHFPLHSKSLHFLIPTLFFSYSYFQCLKF